jgi:hypothetical protein
VKVSPLARPVFFYGDFSMAFQLPQRPTEFRYGQNVTLPDGRTGKVTAKPSQTLLLVKVDGSTERVAVSQTDLRKFN